MTVPNIIDLARALTHTTSTQVTDAQALVYLNIVYHDLENTIVTDVNEDFFWDKLTTDLVAWQNEYVLPIASATVNWVRKISSASIKWTNDYTEYVKLNADSTNNSAYTIDQLRDNTDIWNWFYELREWSVFIYPKPESEIVWWLQLNTILALKDLTGTDTETEIFPNQSTLRQFHHILAIWMKQYIYSQQREFWEKDNAVQEYEALKMKTVNYLQDRNNSPVIWYTQQWTNLMI